MRGLKTAAGEGFRARKLKIGDPDVAGDIKVIRAARDAAGDEIAVMVDCNQSLSVSEAIARARVLDGEELDWIEEPTLAEDFAGHAKIAEAARTPLQMGENWWGIPDMTKKGRKKTGHTACQQHPLSVPLPLGREIEYCQGHTDGNLGDSRLIANRV